MVEYPDALGKLDSVRIGHRVIDCRDRGHRLVFGSQANLEVRDGRVAIEEGEEEIGRIWDWGGEGGHDILLWGEGVGLGYLWEPVVVDVDLGNVGPGNDGSNLECAIVVRNDHAGRGHGLGTLHSGILGRVVVREDGDWSVKRFS